MKPFNLQLQFFSEESNSSHNILVTGTVKRKVFHKLIPFQYEDNMPKVKTSKAWYLTHLSNIFIFFI